VPETYQHPEVRNLVPDLLKRKDGADELSKIGDLVIENYKTDLDSRQQWEIMHAEWLRMYFQTDKPVNPPWTGSSNESIPVLAEAVTQFSARSYKAIFPTGKLLSAVPIGAPDPHSRQRGNRVATHMRWQILYKMPNYKRNKKRLLRSLALHGSFFTKTYYDPIRKNNRVDNVRALDIVVPYGSGPREVEELSRWTHRIPMTIERSQLLERMGYFVDQIEPYEKGDDRKPQDEAHDESTGFQPAVTESGMGLVLEQFMYFDLDDDGYPEPYTVTVDAGSGNVLRVQIGWATDEAGNPVDNFGNVVTDEDPDYLAPVNCLTHYCFMENPDGFYGLGQGHLLAQINASVNKLTRQITDAGTLANAGNHSGFISEQVGGGPEGGVVEMVLGKFKKISATADEMSKGIFQFRFPGPGQALISMLQLLLARGDRLGSSTEAITGQTEKVMQPTTVMALIEQGLEVFSDIYDGLLEAWSHELGIIYRLNFKHMDPQEYFTALDVPEGEQGMQASREDYAPDFQVRPIADPKQATQQQKLQRAQMEYGLLMQNPLVMNSPMHIYNTTRTYLEAIEADDIDARLPNPASQIGRVDDPNVENQMALQDAPMVPMAHQDQDHNLHLQVHIQQMDEGRLTGLGRMLLQSHIEAHRRFNAAGNNQGLASPGGNQMGSPGLTDEVPMAGLGGQALDGGSGQVVGTQNDPGIPPDLARQDGFIQ
jgi:chaperonin GroES